MLIRTAASWLLVLCFVLPLSYCSAKAGEKGRPAAAPITWSGLGIAQEALRDIGVTPAHEVPMLLNLGLVFFVPALCVRLGALRHALIVGASAIPAGLCLHVWVFVIGTPRYGGILAIACWIALTCASAVTLYTAAADRWRRHRSLAT